ncbi:MAG: type IV toxin-antitoxin system AbiEi family antitoxin domain-containing protein [Thermoleophilaceae bacterium]|nr:type IV toxin-antitoxin system AbiEi family antitoxin domain-containing protein [Thermoleophilaceae bacterium]
MARLATAQHGVVSRPQLRELGLSEGAIESGVRLGRLHRVHQGVYAVGYPGLTQQGRLMAATLTSGPRAVLSHCCAAGLWRMYEDRSLTLVHVTLPYGAHGRSRSGIALHRSRSLPEAETTHRGAIPLTTPARTLMDLAASIVETDGYETHRLRGAFESDRERLTVLGYRTLRFTYRQVEGQPLVVANLVRSALRGP